MADFTEKMKFSWPVMLALLAVAGFAIQTQLTAKAAEKTAEAATITVQQKADAASLKEVTADVTLLKVVTAGQASDIKHTKEVVDEIKKEQKATNEKLDKLLQRR